MKGLNMEKLGNIKSQIHNLIKEYCEISNGHDKFVPGLSKVNYAGAMMNYEEVIATVDTMFDGWLGHGKRASLLEDKLSEYLGVEEVILTNSGSSANLIAISTFFSDRMGDKQLKFGDEVITPLVNFPTTASVIYQNGLVPIYVDVELGTYNIDVNRIENMITSKTKVMIIPHILGNPVDMEKIMYLRDKYDLFLIEDACDAIGTKYDGKMVGTFGDVGTFSFYAAHQITTGEGGAIVTNDRKMASIMRSIRDWGRACVCKPCKMVTAKDSICKERLVFKGSNSEKFLYDKRYSYIELGYNLKMTEIQAAIGLEQLKKIEHLNSKRKYNFRRMHEFFKAFEQYFILPKFDEERTDISWFAYPLTVKKDAPFTRNELFSYLELNNIESRFLFAGNLSKQPAFRKKKHVLDSSINSDIINNQAIFLGVYAGVTKEKMNYIHSKVISFINSCLE